MTDANERRDAEPASQTRLAGAARLFAPVLWLLFAGLVVWGGWLFLQACGVDALGLNYCPARADRVALVREASIGDDLTRQVHMAQIAIAEAPVCAPPATQPQPSLSPQSEPAPNPPSSPVVPPPRADSDALDRTVVERGGQNGSLQFTLEWATRDDLDLNVDCPGGRIDSLPGHAGPGICGDGRKDIDANRNLTDNVSTSPIENIVWQDDVPSGDYRIEVIEFKATTRGGNTVPFTLRIRWHGQERICRSAVSTLPESVQQYENGHLVGGTEQLLTWMLGDDLPSCDFQVANTYRAVVPLK